MVAAGQAPCRRIIKEFSDQGLGRNKQNEGAVLE